MKINLQIKGINTAGQALHPPSTAASAASREVLNPSFPHSLDHVRASTDAISLRSSIKPGMINSYLLIVLTVICFLLTVTRHIITGRLSYYFLNWNLFLAAIPWLISLIISSKFVMKKPKILTVVLFIIWLLFFPNSPYIITDLYYLRNHPERTFWYDMIMILMFVWTGLLFGFFSLDRIRELWAEKLSKIKSFIITCVLLFVCAFGIYVGRDLRWNSWEILFAPKEFFFDVIDRLIHPIGYRRAWSFTFIMGGFLNVIYWSLNIIRRNDQSLTDSLNGTTPEW